MSGKHKNHNAEPEALRDFEPTLPTAQGDTPNPAVPAFGYHFNDEENRELFIAKRAPEDTWDTLQGEAFRVYEVMRRAEEWVTLEGIDKEHTELDKENNWTLYRAMNSYAAFFVLLNIERIYFARLEDDTEEAAEEHAYLSELQEKLNLPDGRLGDYLRDPDAMEIQVAAMARGWEDALDWDADTLYFHRTMNKNLAAQAIMAAEAERDAPGWEWKESFHRHMAELSDSPVFFADMLRGYAQHLAKITLEHEAWRPTRMPLADLRVILNYVAPEEQHLLRKALQRIPSSQLQEGLKVPTAPTARHMHKHLMSPKEATADTAKGNRRQTVSYRSWVAIPQHFQDLQPPTRTLERMKSNLLSQKKHSIALVKLHVQLMNLAYQSDGMPFEYDLPQALEALGYSRQSHGGMDSKTLNEHRIRLQTLTAQYIATWQDTKKGKQREWETPYWVIEARGSEPDYDPARMMNVLLRDSNASRFTSVIIRPGLWWQTAEMATKYLEVPAEILALPTDGNGNETERMMVQLTLALAGWVRIGQQQHKGKRRPYGIGTLLEAAHITTEEEFKTCHATKADRIRNSLWSLSPQDGALPRLNALGAFHLELLDESAFYASGRGWRNRFWETQVGLHIPDLQIPATKRNSRRKQLKN